MNIADKMREMIADFGNHFNWVDVESPKAQCENEWCEDYATCHGIHFEPVFDDDYFDYEKLENDIVEHIRNCFGPDALLLAWNDERLKDLPDDQIVLHFNQHCGEVEVYRMRYSRKDKNV